MDAYDSAATEKQVELLKKTWNLPEYTPISPRHWTKLTGIEKCLEVLSVNDLVWKANGVLIQFIKSLNLSRPRN